MSISDDLRELVSHHADTIAAAPWPWEASRWTELIFCALYAVNDDSVRARAAVDAIVAVGMAGQDELVSTEEGGVDRAVLQRVLEQQGFGPLADSAIASLVAISKLLVRSYGGLAQRLLRDEALLMRDRIVERIDPPAEDREVTALAITYWLQNVAALPIPVESALVTEFVYESDAGYEDLWAAADAVGVNAALVDDLLLARSLRAKHDQSTDG